MCFFGIVTRILIIVFGILLPARYTHKALGTNELIGWAKYWIVYAWLVIIELFGDAFFNWLPLYMETKLLLVLWLVISAPQASVWVFDAILNPLMKRYMPRIDYFLMHGKRNMLGDAINYITKLCVHFLDTVLPFVTHLCRRQSMMPAQNDMNVADLAAAASNPSFHERDTNEDTFNGPMCNTHSNTTIAEQKKFSNLSLPDLNAKLPNKPNRAPRIPQNRPPFVQDISNDESCQYEDPLAGMEDLMKCNEMQTHAMPMRKDIRRRI